MLDPIVSFAQCLCGSVFSEPQAAFEDGMVTLSTVAEPTDPDEPCPNCGQDDEHCVCMWLDDD